MKFRASYAAIEPAFVPAHAQPALAALIERAKRKHDGALWFTLEVPRIPRTTGPKSQNNAAHGFERQLSEFTGHDLSEIDMIAKFRAIKRGYPTDVHRDGLVIPWSQSRLDTVQAGYLIDELQQIAAEVGCILVEE